MPHSLPLRVWMDGLALGGKKLQLADVFLCHQTVEQAERPGAPHGSRRTAVPSLTPNFIGL